MMITAKRLVLLLLTGIVIASVACGPSAEELHQKQKDLIQEQKTVMLCEDALKRRADAISTINVTQIESYARPFIEKAEKDIDKYCK